MEKFLQLKNTIVRSSNQDNVSYKILDLLGQGAEGCVYGCEKRLNNQSQCQMAIKFQVYISDKEREFIEKIIKNPQQFQHLIGFYEIFEYNQAVCTVQELADGDLLNYIQQSQNLDSKEKINIFLQIALGIKELHDHKLIHRDLKPENVFKIKNLFKICDFGFLRQVSNKATVGVGTPYYQAPEILQEHGVYNEKVDIWSLALLFYEICTGEILINGNSIVEIIKKIRNYDKAGYDKLIKEKLEPIFTEQQKPLIGLLLQMTSIQYDQRSSIDQVIQQIQQILPKPQPLTIIQRINPNITPPMKQNQIGNPSSTMTNPFVQINQAQSTSIYSTQTPQKQGISNNIRNPIYFLCPVSLPVQASYHKPIQTQQLQQINQTPSISQQQIPSSRDATQSLEINLQTESQSKEIINHQQIQDEPYIQPQKLEKPNDQKINTDNDQSQNNEYP